jgi:hypothetical protein
MFSPITLHRDRWAEQMALGDAIDFLLHRTGVGVDVD